MPANLARVFHPLNGHELKKIILQHITEEMNRDLDFSQHVTYLEAEYDFTMKIKLTPHEAADKTLHVEGGRIECDDKTRQPIVPATPREPKILVLESNRAINLKETPPDKVREDAGLYVPQQQVAGGQVVDVPATELSRDVIEDRTVTLRKDLPGREAE